MAESTAMTTVGLLCPSCGEKLRAARGDVVMYCSGCSRCLEIHRGGLVERGLVSLEPVQPVDPSDPDSLVRIPMWCFKVRADFSGPDPAALSNLRKVASPDHVFVAAVRQRSVQAFGDLGLLMTLKPPSLQSGEHCRFGGATLCSRDAAKLVEPVILLRADQIHDVTDIRVDVTIESVAVVTVPAVDRGDRLSDLVNGKDWPVAAFLDIEAIRWRP